MYGYHFTAASLEAHAQHQREIVQIKGDVADYTPTKDSAEEYRVAFEGLVDLFEDRDGFDQVTAERAAAITIAMKDRSTENLEWGHRESEIARHALGDERQKGKCDLNIQKINDVFAPSEVSEVLSKAGTRLKDAYYGWNYMPLTGMGLRANEAKQAFVSSVGNLASGLGGAIGNASRSKHYKSQEERRLKFVRDVVAANMPSADSTEEQRLNFDELTGILRRRDGLNKPLARRAAAYRVFEESHGWGDATFKSFLTEQALKSEARLSSTDINVALIQEAFAPTRLQSAVTQARDTFMGLAYQPEHNGLSYQTSFAFLVKSLDPEGANRDKAAKVAAVLVGREKDENAVLGYSYATDLQALGTVVTDLATSQGVASFLPDDLSLIAKTTDGQRFAFMPSAMDKLTYTPTANDDENPEYELYFDVVRVAIQNEGYAKADATALTAQEVAKVVERENVSPMDAIKLVAEDKIPTQEVTRNAGMVPAGL